MNNIERTRGRFVSIKPYGMRCDIYLTYYRDSTLIDVIDDRVALVLLSFI